MSSANLRNSAKQYATDKGIVYKEVLELLVELEKDLIIYESVTSLLEGLPAFKNTLGIYIKELRTMVEDLSMREDDEPL